MGSAVASECSTGRNWLQSNYNAAQANATAGDGLGAAPYWFAAGPGRDPGYNGTTAEAKSWGAAQAKQSGDEREAEDSGERSGQQRPIHCADNASSIGRIGRRS